MFHILLFFDTCVLLPDVACKDKQKNQLRNESALCYTSDVLPLYSFHTQDKKDRPSAEPALFLLSVDAYNSRFSCVTWPNVSSYHDPRVSYHDTRVSYHDTHISYHDTRVSYHDTRVSDDDPRISDDDPRVSDDDPRVPDDDPRVSDDDPRVPDDDPRVSDDDPSNLHSVQETASSK
jgi:hypothetical protein